MRSRISRAIWCRVNYALFQVSKRTELVFLVSPVVLNLHIELEEHALVKELLNILACFNAHMLEFSSLMTDDDAFLAVALDIYHRHDMNGVVALVILLYDDLCGIGHLFVVGEQDFLTDNLGNEETGASVGERVLAEVGRALG